MITTYKLNMRFSSVPNLVLWLIFNVNILGVRARVCLSGYKRPRDSLVLNWVSMVLDRDSWFFSRWVPGIMITICNKITANRVKPAKVPLFCYIENYVLYLSTPGGGGGTQGNPRKRCAAKAFKPQPWLRQKLLILLPCLRQETLLSDPDLFCFAYRIT